MSSRPRPLPDPFNREPFRVDQALSRSLGAPRMRRADLVAPAHGVRVLRELDAGWPTFLASIALVLRGDQYLSHSTALRLWSCPLPARLEQATDLHVTTIGPGALMRRPGVVGHRSAAERAAVRALAGSRVSVPELAWYECRIMLSVRELVVVGDHLVGNGALCGRDDLERVIRVGDRRVRSARAALDLIRVGAESPMESIIRVIVVGAGFPEPALNVDVLDADGRFMGRVDMAWVDLRIAVEYDGAHHREDRATFEHDQHRRNAFVVNDWIALHLTALDAREPEAFLARLADAFARRRTGR